MERMSLGQPPSEKGKTMDKTKVRIAEIEAQLNEIDQLNLWDRCETRVDNLLEELDNLKKQLS